VNSVEYNSEIIIAIRPAVGKTIDVEGTLAASISGAYPAYSGTVPTKPSSEGYTYLFTGFDPGVLDSSGNITFTAQFRAVPVGTPTTGAITVTWNDHDGSLLATVGSTVGSYPTYPGPTPSREGDGYTYLFTGFDPGVLDSSGNITFTAQYRAIPDDMVVTGRTLVTWNNHDGSELATAHSTDVFGTPKKLSEDRGFKWSFQLVGDAVVNLRFKDITAQIDFYVNGDLIDPNGAKKVLITYDGDQENYGLNIPLYSTLDSIAQYADNVGTTIGWFTDPACTTPFNPSGYLVLENLSLYTYSNYVIVLHDSDGTGANKFNLLSDGDDKVEIPSLSYDMVNKHKGHIFIGWATNSGADGAKNEFAFIEQDLIPISLFGESKWLDLYAYYLYDGTLDSIYTGSIQYASIRNDATASQDDPASGATTIYYSKTKDFKDDEDYPAPGEGADYSTSMGITHYSESGTANYWMKVVSPQTHNSKNYVGSFTMTIRPFDIYVIAPTAFKIYDGTDLTVLTDQIRYYSLDNSSIPSEIYSEVAFKTDAGYGYTLSDVGLLRTGVVLTLPEAYRGDYAVYTIDGMICIYTPESVKFESWGYVG
ncbi:MAG: hypothetical protein IJ856_05910, partial [Candidatus Methanomethylophilaceae archaeon]|nr:hypothetical protein [Candidatus Methanomethylophilaceae archaeon]